MLFACCAFGVSASQAPTQHPSDAPRHSVSAEIDGDWTGTLQVGDSRLHLVLHISKQGKGELHGTLDSLDQGVYGMALSSIFHLQDTVSFELSNLGVSYQAKLSPDRKLITGMWKQSGMGLPLIFHREAASAGSHRPAGSVSAAEGTWQGALQMNGLRLRLQLHVSHDTEGNLVAGLDSLDEGVSGVPAVNVSEKSGTLHFEVTQLNGAYDGKLDAAKNTLSGRWIQAGEEHDLDFTRSNRVLEARRPQNPVKPYPYGEEEVQFENGSAKITLAGTLTLPKGRDLFLRLC